MIFVCTIKLGKKASFTIYIFLFLMLECLHNMEDINDVTYRLRKIIPVTRKEDPICANNIYLSKKKETTFGRIVSSDVQERLLSKNTPLMISRKHATIFVEGGNIKISDHQSMNGVYINNKRIRPGVQHSIKHGDKIAFGCGVDSAPPEFEYVVEAVCSNHLKRHDNYEIQEERQGSPSKRQKAADIPGIMIIESNSVHIKEQEEKIKKLTQELQQKEYHQNELLNKLQEKEKGLIAKLEQQKCDLERDRSDAEEYLKGLLQKQLTEKENFLRSEYDEQINNLQSEKDFVEKNLQEELSKKLSEKDKAYQQELEQQKSMLEQAMLSKEHEKYVLIAELQAKEGLIEKYKSVEENQKQLESCLQELKKEIQEKENQLKKQQEVTKKVELDAKQTVIQTMEDEFTCIICQELFIEATTLPCAHTFCEVCLRLWMRKKKTCPVCRRRIKDKAVRSVVLDSAVEKMIDSMDDETKQRRKVLLRERSEQKRRDDATEDPDGIKNMIHRPGEENDNDVPQQAGTGRNNHQDSRNRRESNRRRSRSRSPRFLNNRHRPYHDYRNNNNNVGRHHYQHQQIPSFINQVHYNHNRDYHHERTDNYQHHYFHLGNVGYNNNNNYNIRCYNCGGVDHLARFCPRR